jgi:hypothetical protein
LENNLKTAFKVNPDPLLKNYLDISTEIPTEKADVMTRQLAGTFTLKTSTYSSSSSNPVSQLK